MTIGADISAYQSGMQEAASIARTRMDALKADLQAYQTLAENTFDPALLGHYNNQITNIQSRINSLGREAQVTANATREIATEGVSGLNALGGATQSASMRFAQMRSGISAARDGLMGFTIGGQAGDRMLMAMGHHINSLVNETGSFKGAMSAMGQSLMGPGGIILVLTAAFELFKHFSKAEDEAYDATKHFTDAVDAQHAVVQNLDSSYADAVKNVAELTENVKLAKDGFINKNEVVKEYNETLGKTMGAVKTLDEVEKKLVSGGQAYIKMMLYKAAAQTALKEASDKSLEAAKAQLEDQSKFESFGAKAASFSLGSTTAPGIVPGADPIKASKDRAEALKQFAEKARAEQIASYQKDEDKLIKIANEFQDKAAQIAGKNKWNFFPDQKPVKVKEEVTGLDLLIQKAKEAETAFNDAVANNAIKPGSVSETALTQLAKQAADARVKVNEVKAAIVAIKLELARQENIKEFGSVFPIAKQAVPTDISGQSKTDLTAAQADIDIEEAKKAVGAIVAANAEILSDVQEQYDKGLINIKTYLQQKYFLEESNLSKERSLYAEGTVQYANYTNKMTNLTKRYDEEIKKANEPTRQYMQTIKELSHVLGSGLANAFQQALSGTQSFISALGQFIVQLIEKLIAAAAAAAVLAVLLEVTGFGAFTSSFGSIFGQLSGLGSALGSISSSSSGGGGGNARGFATGGIFTQPHVGMFAEAGPEAIVTPKHLADFAGVSQGEQNQTLTMKLQGSDMLLFLNRANKTKSRTS